jgi:Carboxypeptidase regulatory-like domain
MLKKFCLSSALLALFMSLTTLGFAQGSAESTVKGNVAAYVSDPSGATVADAKVTLSGPTGDKVLSTGSDGKVLFQILTPGSYTVKIEKTGFKTSDVKDVEVVVGKTSVVNAKLEIGAASTTVEVTADAITVDTTSTSNGANLNDQFYQSVPVARGVTGLFYAASGVASGGGTGTANPSISGATGLENNYVADGVSITDGGFGGIGVYSRNYGSLSTGINLSFVKEVDVKTGGFEAQYGKSTGGIVQIVTKSGANHFFGSLGGYFAPQRFEATRLFSDDYAQGTQNERFNLQGKILHQGSYDVDAQIGGYVPGLKEHLFFFGAFNPQWNTDYDQFAQFRNPSDLGNSNTPTQTSLGNVNIPIKVYSYAGKGTFKINDNHQIEASLFGDPTYGQQSPNGNGGLVSASNTTFDKLQYGTRNFVVRYNGTLSPSWLVNASFSLGHNSLSDTPLAPNVFSISDLVQRNPCGAPLFNPDCLATTNPARGQFQRQGDGYWENTKGDNYGLNFDSSKSFHFLGQHNLTVGYRYDRGHYDGTKAFGGGHIAVDTQLANDVVDPVQFPVANAELLANGTTAELQLRSRIGNCIENATDPSGNPDIRYAAEISIPGIGNCIDGGEGVYLLQVRGEFDPLGFKTTSRYHTLFAQDSWSPNKYVSINAGIRWEQQHVQGNNSGYTFNDNWSPRLGISVDPWGNRKTKITANFGRYTEALPLDIAIRSLSNENDFADPFWVPPTDGAGHVVIASDGTIDLSKLVGTETAQTDGGFVKFPTFGSGASLGTGEQFGKGTRSEYLDEYVLGFEHEFGNSGVVFSARYTDRRIKRIVEDNAALSVEAFQCCLNQQYVISNPNKKQDLFVNPIQVDFSSAGPVPAACVGQPQGQPTDSNGNIVTNSAGNDSFCITNPGVAGNLGGDGIPDGFVDPVRIYKAVEFEVNKSMSRGWQMRANYRIARLVGNYEGSFRNDNGQNDPNISSLFDFTRGDFNLLGQQFVPGVLNTDVHHLANGFVSYTLHGSHAAGLTFGSSVHFQTGVPINNLFAHPGYQNAGEIPFCADNTTNCPSARGALGRTLNSGSVDAHMDYPIRISEGKRLRLMADLFNLSNNRTQLREDQFAQRSAGVPNADFTKPTGNGPSAVNGNTNPGYQRPFSARFGVKLEF